MHKPRVILHATDFSQRSTYALKLACSLAREAGCELNLLHVLPSLRDVVGRRKSENALKHLVKSDPTVAMKWAVLVGDPAEKILWMADEVASDMIVLAASGRNDLGALFSRSTSRNVERRARCPVVRLDVPAAWLSKVGSEGSRCVYCDTPRNQSTVGNIQHARTDLLSEQAYQKLAG